MNHQAKERSVSNISDLFYLSAELTEERKEYNEGAESFELKFKERTNLNKTQRS